MGKSVGIRALATYFPRHVRTNDYWRTKYPELVAAAERKRRTSVWNAQTMEEQPNSFDIEMARYLDDPFRGAVERRVLGPGENGVSMEMEAARRALDAVNMTPRDVDLALVSEVIDDRIWVGNAPFFARDFGLKCAAWNLETACTSALAAQQLATSLVSAGEYGNVLSVVSCSYSRAITDDDPMSWLSGDGAAAFVIGPTKPGYGWLGAKTINTAYTCDCFIGEAAHDPEHGDKFLLRATKAAGMKLREVSEAYLRPCVDGALQAAGVSLRDIDFFVFPTPTAWYSAFCCRVLDVSPERTIDTFPRFANVGPMLMPANLYYAAKYGRIKAGDLVLMYTIGSVSSAGAAVMRWPEDVALGPDTALAPTVG